MSLAAHPAHASHPLDEPVSPQTGLALLAKLGVTEAEAKAFLAMSNATAEQVDDSEKTNLHAIGAALDETTAHSIATDPKLELGPLGQNFEQRANGVRLASSLSDKLTTAIDDIHAASRVDAGTLQEVLGGIVPQIRSRARVSIAVKKTYSSVLAYWHARYPGKRTHAPAATAPAKTASTASLGEDGERRPLEASALRRGEGSPPGFQADGSELKGGWLHVEAGWLRGHGSGLRLEAAGASRRSQAASGRRASLL
jgi:hypothetical protein